MEIMLCLNIDAEANKKLGMLAHHGQVNPSTVARLLLEGSIEKQWQSHLKNAEQMKTLYNEHTR